MGKLTALKPQLGGIPPQLGYAQGDEKAQDKSRNQWAPWRAWYSTARWQKLRHQVFLRDAYKCQRTGVLAIGKYPAPNSPVANHKRPHRGDPALFWNIDNIETITKAEHDRIVQVEERKLEQSRG